MIGTRVSNYETWLIISWLDRDKRLKAKCTKLVNNSNWSTDTHYGMKDLAQDAVSSMIPTVLALLLNDALDQVNWWEVCRHFEGETSI